MAGAWGDGPSVVAVDERGQGVHFNNQLIQAKFHAPPGALPVSADAAGRYCVLRHPDGSHSLLQAGRVVFSHPAGTLAVSPAADAFAVGDERGVRVLSAAAFEALLHGQHLPAWLAPESGA